MARPPAPSRLAQIDLDGDAIRDRYELALLHEFLNHGKPVVGVEILRTKGAGEIDVARGVREAVAQLREAHPQIVLTEVIDNAQPIEDDFEGSMALLYEGSALARGLSVPDREGGAASGRGRRSSAGAGAPGSNSGAGSGTVVVVKETDTTEIGPWTYTGSGQVATRPAFWATGYVHKGDQLKIVGMEHKMDAALEEAGRVRAEFGYPIMVTPLSQFVGSQAAINVIVGERYKQVTDQTIEYAMGIWGKEGAAYTAPEVVRV